MRERIETVIKMMQRLQAVGAVAAIVLGLIAALVILGPDLPVDVWAVIIGVLSGVVAGLPTSVLLLIVLTRRERQGQDLAEGKVPGNYPPVVVIEGDHHAALNRWPSYEVPTKREFRVVDNEGGLLIGEGKS